MSDHLKKQFLEALNSNVRIIHSICRAYFPDTEERKDAYQEMVYQLWKSYPQFSGASKFSTWMYRVALNTAFTRIRKNTRSPVNTRLADSDYQIAAESPDPMEDKIADLYKAIHTLNDIDKAVVLLYLDDNSYEEIAAVTGLTKGNVSVRLFRIRKALEEKMKLNPDR